MTDREEFAARVIQSLVTDLADRRKLDEAIRIKVETLAKEFGVKIPAVD
jgi:hypothetical protein